MTIIKRMMALVMLMITVGAFAADGDITERTLPNGLKVIIKEVHAAPVFTSQVWYKVGSRNEHTGITGVSHIVEHMLFKGTKQYGKGEFARLIESKGGMQNAATWIDYTNYWELLSSEHLELALRLEADRMTNALFDPKEFASEKIVVRSELEGRENRPDMLLYQAIQATAYKVHPYRWPTIGWVSDVENVSREQAYKYYKTYYHPNNATLVIVGDVDPVKTMALVRRYFGPIPKGPKVPEVYTKEPKQEGERRFTLNREGTAERVMIAYHIPEMTHPDTYPLMVLDQVLSGGKSSRLYQSLVETGLASSAWSSLGSRRDPGLFMLSATGQGKTTADALEKALLEQVEKAKAAPPSDTEMAAAVNQLEAYLVFQNDSVSDQGEQIGYFETVASRKYLDELLPNVKKVKPADVQRVAKTYLIQSTRTVGHFVPTSAPTGGIEPGGAPAELHYREAADVEQRAASNSVSPTGVRGGAVPAAKASRTVLDNGMVVIVQENHSNQTFAIQGSLNAGGYYDPQGKNGLASFTAEMLSRGTTSRSALDIAKEIDYVGASVDCSSDTEAARFSAKGLSKDFNRLLDILSDQLRNPSFPEDQIANLKGQMLSALSRENENPEARAIRQFNRAIFPAGHPFRPQTVEEDRASISSIGRDDLVEFHKQYYGPETAVIVIVGDVKTDEAVAAVRRYFGDWKPAGRPKEMVIPRTQLAAEASKDVISMPDKSQVNVVFGHAGQLSRRDPDFYAATVMNYILGGGGLESKLGRKVRDDLGLVYFIYSYFDASQGDGPWVGGFGTNPNNTDKAIAATNEVIREYIENGPTQAEVTQAIDYITGSFPIRLETNDGVANVLMSAETYDLGMDYIERYPKIYRSVTLEQVRAVAKKYLHPDRLTLVIAGPYEK